MNDSCLLSSYAVSSALFCSRTIYSNLRNINKKEILLFQVNTKFMLLLYLSQFTSLFAHMKISNVY